MFSSITLPPLRDPRPLQRLRIMQPQQHSTSNPPMPDISQGPRVSKLSMNLCSTITGADASATLSAARRRRRD